MDGLNSPRELMEVAKAHGQTAMAITDHGVLSGHRKLQEAATELGIKPLLGLEAYISPTDRFDRRAVNKRDDNTQIYNHLIIIAQNESGRKNLNALSKRAWEEGYYYKPRIDKELLLEHKEGLIILSGCMNGLIAKAIQREDPEEAAALTEWFSNEFQDNFYMEIQPHNPPELNAAMLSLADKNGIKSVVTSDCHYAKKEDRALEEIMLILSTSPNDNKTATYESGKKISSSMLERLNHLYPDRKLSFEKIDVFLGDRLDVESGMLAQGVARQDIYYNTLEIADKVEEYEYHKNLNLLPTSSSNPAQELKNKVKAGLKKKDIDTPEYISRAQEELKVISDKNFDPYFLIVADTVDWARQQGILVGPGRGSGAGSLVNYALGITDVDPVAHNLLFMRFLNPDRADWPDIDVDFEDRRRKEVKDYLAKKYGHIASIATYTRFLGKNALKDVSRVLKVPITEVNRATKNCDPPPGSDFFEYFVTTELGKQFAKKYPDVIEYAKKLQGKIRGQGLHASGVIVSKEAIDMYAPIETAKDPRDQNGPRIPVVAMEMDDVADVGLQKLDLLGLKALSIISDAKKQIMSRHSKDIDFKALGYSDTAIYRDISSGYTQAVFQAEQNSSTKLIMNMGGVANFEELSASNALVRPGAMNTIGKEYIERKEGRKRVRYCHPDVESFTKETYGEVLYQEQVMQMMTELAGMKMSTADKVRKIIGKKKDVSEFDQFKAEFIAGASKKVDIKVAEKLWHDFEAHAGYSFNKSHSVAYSMISYQTAWLKHYYPLEFMYAVLVNEGDQNSLAKYFIECKRLGIRIRFPHVEKSQLGFAIEDAAIRMGLSNIKGLSDKTAQRFIENRPFGSYANLETFVKEKGTGVTSSQLSSLNKIGAAVYDDNEKQDIRENLYEYLKIPAFNTDGIDPRILIQVSNLSDFDESDTAIVMAMVTNVKRGPEGSGWSLIDILDETGTVSIFADEQTPIEKGNLYFLLIGSNRVELHARVDELKDKENLLVKYMRSKLSTVVDDFVYVISFNPKTTRAGKKMATVVVADSDRDMQTFPVWSNNFFKCYSHMKPGNIVQIRVGQTPDGRTFIADVIG